MKYALHISRALSKSPIAFVELIGKLGSAIVKLYKARRHSGVTSFQQCARLVGFGYGPVLVREGKMLDDAVAGLVIDCGGAAARDIRNQHWTQECPRII